MRSFFRALDVIELDMDIMHPDCIKRLTPLEKYALNLGFVFAILALLVLMYLVDSVVCRQGRFRQQAPALLQSCGTIVIAFLVGIVSLMTRPLQGFPHPNGVYTVTKYPTVLWGEGDHDKMLIIAAPSLLMPIAFVSAACWAVRQYPARIMMGDLFFLRCWRLLFFRFHPKAYWYGPVLNSRNVATALGPVLPAAFAQIALLQLVLALSLSLIVGVLPWRVKGANVIDCACHVCLLAMVLPAAFFAEDKYLTEVANLCFIVAILMLCVLPIGLGVAGLKAAQKSSKEEFQYFICHHKQGAGAMARLLKIRLKSTAGVKRKVFIGSDDLKDLTKLQDCVANDTNH